MCPLALRGQKLTVTFLSKICTSARDLHHKTVSHYTKREASSAPLTTCALIHFPKVVFTHTAFVSLVPHISCSLFSVRHNKPQHCGGHSLLSPKAHHHQDIVDPGVTNLALAFIFFISSLWLSTPSRDTNLLRFLAPFSKVLCSLVWTSKANRSRAEWGKLKKTALTVFKPLERTCRDRGRTLFGLYVCLGFFKWLDGPVRWVSHKPTVTSARRHSAFLNDSHSICRMTTILVCFLVIMMITYLMLYTIQARHTLCLNFTNINPKYSTNTPLLFTSKSGSTGIRKN